MFVHMVIVRILLNANGATVFVLDLQCTIDTRFGRNI